MTAEYRVAKRPRGRVLVDYNQNAWGRTLASVYSVRPTAARARLHARHLGRDRRAASRIEDFRLDNVRARFATTGDLWKPLLQKAKRVDLRNYL